MTPQIKKIKTGWAAVAPGWAVFGATQEEALERFGSAESKHQEIADRRDAQTDN